MHQAETAKAQVTKPFEHEETLKNISRQFTAINSELDMDKESNEQPVFVDENEDILGLDGEAPNVNDYEEEEDEPEI